MERTFSSLTTAASGICAVFLACALTPCATAQTPPPNAGQVQKQVSGPIASTPTKRIKKGKKQEPQLQLPPQPPPPPPTPEQMPANPPEVIYSGGLLTIRAQNSTMNDVLSAVRRVTGASIEKPPMGGADRVVATLGPGQPKDVLESLFQGSRYDYIILGPTSRPGGVERVILTARRGNQQGGAPPNPAGQSPRPNVQPSGTAQEEPDTDVEDMTVPEREEPEQPEPQVQPQGQPGQQQVTPQQYPQGLPQQPPQEQAQPQDQQNQGQQPRVKSPEELLRELQQMQRQPPDQNQQQDQQSPQ